MKKKVSKTYVVLPYHIHLLGWGMASREETELHEIYEKCAAKPFVLNLLIVYTILV